MARGTGSRLRTLYLYANGVGPHVIRADTVLRGIFGYRDGDLPPRAMRNYARVNAFFSLLRDFNERLSYMADWRDAFLASPALGVEVCNINNLVHLARCLIGIRGYDLIVVAHSAAGDDMTVLGRSAGWFQRRRGKLVMFIGNEYDLLDEKIAFLRGTGAEFVCSQLPIAAARYLYAECPDAEILEMPHALNPRNYYPLPDAKRDIDVGFVGDIYWPFVGDRERTDLIEWFERNGSGRGLAVDVRRERLSREEWMRYLNGCKAIVGAESGTYYLNDRGRLLTKARDYNLFQDRKATFDDVFERFYRGQPREVSGKSISSRHFEAIGTKTCQLLLEGDYNGILKPEVHYIGVRKDLSDIDAALERFRDEPYRQRIAENAYEHVRARHTYGHRVAHLLERVT